MLLTLENWSSSQNTGDYSSLNYILSNPPLYLGVLGKNVFGFSGGAVYPAYTSRFFSGQYTSFFLGCRCYLSPGAGYYGFVSILGGPANNLNTTQIGVQFNIDGTLSVFQQAVQGGAFGITTYTPVQIFYTTTNSVFVPGVPFYFEMNLVEGTNTGSLQVKINQVTVILLTGINSNPSGTGFFKGYGLYSAANSGGPFITDIYVCDPTGTSWNTFQGDINVQTIQPISNNTVQFTPVGNSQNWQNLISDHQPVSNTVTAWNAGNIVNQTDLVNMGNLTANTTQILGMVMRSQASGPAGGLHTFEQLIYSNANVVTSNVLTLTTAYIYYDTVFNTDPSTGNVWTVGSVNDLVTGYKLLS